MIANTQAKIGRSIKKLAMALKPRNHSLTASFRIPHVATKHWPVIKMINIGKINKVLLKMAYFYVRLCRRPCNYLQHLLADQCGNRVKKSTSMLSTLPLITGENVEKKRRCVKKCLVASRLVL
jgi:hypothetical protein